MSFTRQPSFTGLIFLLHLAFQQALGHAGEEKSRLPFQVKSFRQQKHVGYSEADGLSLKNIQAIRCGDDGSVTVTTPQGSAKYTSGNWKTISKPSTESAASDSSDGVLQKYPSLSQFIEDQASVRQVAEHQNEIAVAAEAGLFLGDGKSWTMALPRQAGIRWAPLDVRAVAYDTVGRLWFACPQGVGVRVDTDEWELFTGSDGLPFNDFTCMAAGPQGIWLGTTNGAIRYYRGDWEFRQGKRWLLDNHVTDIAVDKNGNAWLATPAGLSCIESVPMTLAQKAAYFEKEIDRYHRRTEFGYVNPCEMSSPGDKSTAVPKFRDNDGHYMGLYIAAVSLGYSATQNEKLRNDAHRAFDALAFLSEVTQGGPHPAPPGFIARNIVSTADADPNSQYDLAYDIRRNKADALWKIIQPRLPVDESGKWYWKCDSSSDELDGHYLGYGTYYDHICKTEAEKEKVRAVVRRVTDHLLKHNFTQVDYDGRPTRWGHFAPEDLNQNEQWWQERGLNSLSILTYLNVAHHVTSDQKYRDAYLKLAHDHGYAMNGMTQAKHESGPGSFGQGDDAMAFMNYYHLLKYETDPKLLNMYRFAVYRHWQIEQYERNPMFNFIYAAYNLNKTFDDHWGSLDLSPSNSWLEDSIDTLKRYPLDRTNWPMSNAHRIDMLPLPQHVREPGQNVGFGFRVDGRPFRIDEQYLPTWGHDPWHLTNDSTGSKLSDGVSYLLAYYLGLAHGFIAE